MAVPPVKGEVAWNPPFLTENNPAEMTPAADTPNLSSLVGRVSPIQSASTSSSSWDWSVSSTKSAAPPTEETPPTMSLISSCNIYGVASSTHSAPPVPKLDLDRRHRRTSSAPPTITPKTSPSDSASTTISIESPLSKPVFANLSPPSIEKL